MSEASRVQWETVARAVDLARRHAIKPVDGYYTLSITSAERTALREVYVLNQVSEGGPVVVRWPLRLEFFVELLRRGAKISVRLTEPRPPV